MKLLTKDAAAKPHHNAHRAKVEHVPEVLLRDLGEIFKLLSDDTRLRILYYLTQTDELHVRALCERLRESQPAVSHHLALLRVAGLIDRRREGKHNFYTLKSRRISKLLDMLFATMPEGNRRIRFDEYVLSHAPVGSSRAGR